MKKRQKIKNAKKELLAGFITEDYMVYFMEKALRKRRNKKPDLIFSQVRFLMGPGKKPFGD